MNNHKENPTIEKKMEEVLKNFPLWIEDRFSGPEKYEVAEFLELQWKVTNLLSKIAERERIYRREREELFGEMWDLTKASLARMKATTEESEVNKPEGDGEGKRYKKRIKLMIDQQLWQRIDQYIKENFSSLSLFFNGALRAYKEGMNLTSLAESKENKRIIAPWITEEALAIHQELPMKEKSAKLEIILHSYLEKMK